MDSTLSDDMEAIVEESSEQSNTPYASYLSGISGAPEIIPRVGDQYQAEVPDLKLAYVSAKSRCEFHTKKSFSLGLPIPVMWSKGEKFTSFLEAEGENQNPVDEQTEKPKPKTDLGTKPRVTVIALPCQANLGGKLNWLALSVCPFPGSLGESWGNAERGRFLLGLYTLGKDLNAVKRLVESKNMEDILSFYYGNFYESNEYKRWSEGQSLRSKKSVQGRKLFSGWRQQELLSRISCHVSDECKAVLHEVSQAFTEEKISLGEYVFTLKDTVGMNLLVEAIGIGKGKKDLTGNAMEPPKTIHAVCANSEVPTGKACSSLSSADIIKFLTGGLRLSKARSNDLFWEAVWPRLLARGWHTEQLKVHSRNSLVFLTPGIKKFSRRKLVKGNHYFDSVSDVLNKVASESGLLELETEETKENEKTKENGKDAGRQEDDLVDLPGNKPHRYLKPGSINQTRDGMKFTIVDTSVFNGAENREVRDLRSLPVGDGNMSTISSGFLNESEHNLPEETKNEAEERTKTSVYVNGTLKTEKSKSADKDVSKGSGSVNQKQRKNREQKTSYTTHQSVGVKRHSLKDSANGESIHGTENVSGQKKSKNKESLARSQENPVSRVDFDLNVPQVPPDFENDEPIIVADKVQNGDSSLTDQPTAQVEKSGLSKPQKLPHGETSTGQQTNRKKSTRNRPLTAKALEAFAFGYLGSPRKKRNNTEGSRSNSRPTRGRNVVTSECSNGGNDASNPDENK